MLNKKNIKLCFYIRVLCLLMGMISFFVGWKLLNFNVLGISLLLIWLNNLIFGVEKICTRFIFIVLHISIFTFLLSRPVIGAFRGGEWWVESAQSMENIKFALLVIMLSLIALYIGAEIAERFIKEKKVEENTYKKDFRQLLQAVSLIVFVITMFFFMAQEMEKLLSMMGKNYVLFYTGFQNGLPSIIYTLASFMKYSLCIFLATLPSKKKAFLPLLAYGFSAIPSLVVGVRNPIVLNAMFIVTYYVIRDVLQDRKKWIGKIEKILLVAGTPVMLVFMNIYAYIRSGNIVGNWNPIKQIADFFYGQGVTFNVLAIGYGHRFNLPERPFRNYTFGGALDYIHYGTIGQTIFNVAPLPEGNNWTNGRLSNSLSHNLAYAENKNSYLNGHGWGSSYLLENFVDFGYIGVLIFSLVLGIILVMMMKKIGKNTLVSTIILISLMGIFFIPRAEATGWLTFIITIQFWACIAGCYFGAYICSKSSVLQKILQMLRLYPIKIR